MNALHLTILPQRLAFCRLPASAALPLWVSNNHSPSFLSITYTSEELSIVADHQIIPEKVQADRDWRAIKVIGPLDFALVGILASLAGTLAQAQISIFAISTFDTDYLLVKEAALAPAILALTDAGHTIIKEKI